MTVIIFLGLNCFLIFAFVNLDRLVKMEYTMYRDRWVEDGKPRRFFWRPTDSPFFSSLMAMHRLTLYWLFKTPPWIVIDTEAGKLLGRFRASMLIWYIGVMIWFIFRMPT